MTEAPLPAQPVATTAAADPAAAPVSNRKRRSVRFSASQLAIHHCFEGVTPDEADNVWFRRTEYVEFVENELRRRELLSAIEATATATATSHRRASTPLQRATLQRASSTHVVANTTTSCQEGAMKHTFSKRMVSRALSSGPPRRRRQLPRREQNDMDALVLEHRVVTTTTTTTTQKKQPQLPAAAKATTEELPFVVDPTSPARRRNHTGHESSKNRTTETPPCIAARAS